MIKPMKVTITITDTDDGRSQTDMVFEPPLDPDKHMDSCAAHTALMIAEFLKKADGLESMVAITKDRD